MCCSSAEAIATIGMFVFAFGLHVLVQPEPLPFLEQDLTLSYALTRPETIPIWLLFVLSISVPASFIVLGHLYHAYKRRGSFRTTLKSFLWCQLGVLQALAIVFSITNLLKTMTGRQRPNFFALCNYAGYNDAITSGDFTSYFANTVFGAFGDLKKCQSDFSDVAESLRSFPSGHSSISFAGMTFAALYLRASFGVVKGVHVSVRAILSSFPWILSAYIACSRVRDRWHNTDDVFIGSAIGLLSGFLAWQHYVTLRKEGVAPRHGAAHLDPRVDAEELTLKVPGNAFHSPTEFTVPAMPSHSPSSQNSAYDSEVSTPVAALRPKINPMLLLALSKLRRSSSEPIDATAQHHSSRQQHYQQDAEIELKARTGSPLAAVASSNSGGGTGVGAPPSSSGKSNVTGAELFALAEGLPQPAPVIPTTGTAVTSRL